MCIYIYTWPIWFDDLPTVIMCSNQKTRACCIHACIFFGSEQSELLSGNFT